MAISRVQAKGAPADDTTSIALAFDSNVTAGNLLVIYAMKYSPADTDVFEIGDISQSAGTATLGTFALDVEHVYDAGTDGVMAAVYSVPVTGSGSCTIQVAGSNSGSYLLLAIEELSGADVSGTRLVGTNEATGNSTTPDSGTVNSGGAGIFCGCCATYAGDGHTFTEDGAFTLIYEQETIDHATGSAISRIVSSGTTDSASWTNGTAYGWVAVLAVYKEASGAPTAPTVTTQAVSAIGTTTATGNGNVTADGGATVTERGVVANTTGTPTTSDLKFTAASGGTGAFTASMTGLDPDTHYYVRAYAINSEGTAYGSEVEFDTDAEPATLEQSAYQFFADDDGEGAATPLDDENTAVSVIVGDNFRARLQVDATGNPDATPFRLEYRRLMSTEPDVWSDWYPVPVAMDDAMLLSVSSVNGRYLVDGNGAPVLLTGFHTWGDVQDSGASDPPSAFDWDEYLTALTSRGLNFTKLWGYESPRGWGRYRLQPRYARTGPGNAADGKLKFDTTAVSEEYLARLESRVADCYAAGIWACVQLFQGWDIVEKDGSIENPAPYHPFLPDNNISSVDGDTNDNGDLEETHILASNPVIDVQEDFVTAVIDRLNAYPNIFYEISNESTGGTGNTNWQYSMIDVVQAYEATLPKQHLVIMTVQYPSGSNTVLNDSNAELVSYNNRDSVSGTKVSMSDTDHIEGLTDQFEWVWVSLCNGHGGLWYMDSWDGSGFSTDTRANSTYILIRDNLGYAAALVALLADLEGMTPQSGLSTTGYCLAKNHATAGEYIVYYNGSSTFNLNLSTATGTLNIRWLRCSNGTVDTGSTVSGGATRTLTPPWTGAVVAYVYH